MHPPTHVQAARLVIETTRDHLADPARWLQGAFSAPPAEADALPRACLWTALRLAARQLFGDPLPRRGHVAFSLACRRLQHQIVRFRNPHAQPPAPPVSPVPQTVITDWNDHSTRRHRHLTDVLDACLANDP